MKDITECLRYCLGNGFDDSYLHNQRNVNRMVPTREVSGLQNYKKVHLDRRYPCLIYMNKSMMKLVLNSHYGKSQRICNENNVPVSFL